MVVDDEWLCPECTAGGRGQSAGLRVPFAARNAMGETATIAHGAAFVAGVARGRGYEEEAGMRCLVGKEALGWMGQAGEWGWVG